jgi:hypothetical protein
MQLVNEEEIDRTQLANEEDAKAIDRTQLVNGLFFIRAKLVRRGEPNCPRKNSFIISICSKLARW